MINIYEVNETNNMIEHEKLDVRTITMGISLLDCADSDLDTVNEKIYKKITTLAKNLVSTGKDIERDFGIPTVSFPTTVMIALLIFHSPLLFLYSRTRAFALYRLLTQTVRSLQANYFTHFISGGNGNGKSRCYRSAADHRKQGKGFGGSRTADLLF